MKITCVFGTANANKTAYVDSLAWVQEAVVLRTSDYNFRTIEERLGCVLGIFLAQRWNNHNFVIDIDDDSIEARKLCITLFKDKDNELIAVNATEAKFSEGWDDIWNGSSCGPHISTTF